MIALYLVLGAIAGFSLAFIVCYFIPNREIDKANENLAKQQQQIQEEIKVLSEEAEKRIKENLAYEQAFIDRKLALEDQMEKAIEALGEKYQRYEEEYQDEYLNATKDAALSFQRLAEKDKETYMAALEEAKEEHENKLLEYKDIEDKCVAKCTQVEGYLSELQKKVAAANESIRVAELKEQEEKFYKLQITDRDLEEVNKFRSIQEYFRDPVPLYKVIWKTYFQKPYTDLMGRLMGSGSAIGIYKITDLTTGKCYIGQSVDIKTRLSNHIKAGLGIDATNNKLYTAMKEHGVENFSYEILETCEQAKLNQEEKYWINFFSSDTLGLNMTVGGSAKK